MLKHPGKRVLKETDIGIAHLGRTSGGSGMQRIHSRTGSCIQHHGRTESYSKQAASTRCSCSQDASATHQRNAERGPGALRTVTNTGRLEWAILYSSVPVAWPVKAGVVRTQRWAAKQTAPTGCRTHSTRGPPCARQWHHVGLVLKEVVRDTAILSPRVCREDPRLSPRWCARKSWVDHP